ncbi:hypothetical protein TNCT_508941 [Trichonephila clavata]|uniref:Uncharacterized protein n=1 Tax=Trichonephila clavata TaxID=2740835 RepID=A0A8X6FNZ3_TRICU|nr:hypothetical protein TNCT_508941 [Trichonephila clavata]
MVKCKCTHIYWKLLEVCGDNETSCHAIVCMLRPRVRNHGEWSVSSSAIIINLSELASTLKVILASGFALLKQNQTIAVAWCRCRERDANSDINLVI